MALKARLRTPVVEATQWFKTGDHPKVIGKPDYWCGCVVFGGPGDKPHLHFPGGSFLVDPGDWVIDRPDGTIVISDEDFKRDYEAVASGGEL